MLLIDAAACLPFALMHIAGRVPGDHPPALGEGRHDGKVLVAVRPGIDLRLVAMGRAVGIVALLINAETGSVLVDRLPGDDPSAIGELREARVALVAH
jgi:hypothetical protein